MCRPSPHRRLSVTPYLTWIVVFFLMDRVGSGLETGRLDTKFMYEQQKSVTYTHAPQVRSQKVVIVPLSIDHVWIVDLLANIPTL